MRNDIQIIIDPGHGGTETGAVANGYKEKDLNLEISLELARVLRGYFSGVLMTRTKDEYFDLSRRAAWVAKKAAEFSGKTICPCVHLNAYNGQARGAEVIYSIHSDAKLATCIVEKICSLGLPFRRVFSKESSVNKGQDYYCMHRATGSAQTVIIESLFLDNAYDVAFLKQPEFIPKLAQKIGEGLLTYLQIPEEKPKPATLQLQQPPKIHQFKKDNDELMAAGILKSDHTLTLDNQATEGFVIALVNRLRKDGK
ncbi:N-acetylmuramoyl-L-alanine amidase [Pseudobacteroides cellulosolvens]|uniref:Cell wall hydrolase/autolysin n=1 Tax=Pseudobacteroides cellulosolvens ATCC 35603 = DSM 2933 TaxID=398512 RepID=A0A0L6JGL3_9FIRM|nr:N-acetylmuramoyl-L-alanine amidase [Pseudobacteroides cellulosolvens]KNY24853.1 cell wall hydrolase/autolysin [Pseudobacteroides cellulosolvens ATCC 35603 = DSM 2933]